VQTLISSFYSSFLFKLCQKVTQAVDEFVQKAGLHLDVGAKSKPPGVSNAAVALPLTWSYPKA
jgi:hypothetical protein